MGAIPAIDLTGIITNLTGHATTGGLVGSIALSALSSIASSAVSHALAGQGLQLPLPLPGLTPAAPAPAPAPAPAGATMALTTFVTLPAATQQALVSAGVHLV